MDKAHIASEIKLLIQEKENFDNSIQLASLAFVLDLAHVTTDNAKTSTDSPLYIPMV